MFRNELVRESNQFPDFSTANSPHKRTLVLQIPHPKVMTSGQFRLRMKFEEAVAKVLGLQSSLSCFLPSAKNNKFMLFFSVLQAEVLENTILQYAHLENCKRARYLAATDFMAHKLRIQFPQRLVSRELFTIAIRSLFLQVCSFSRMIATSPLVPAFFCLSMQTALRLEVAPSWMPRSIGRMLFLRSRCFPPALPRLPIRSTEKC